MPCDQVKFHFVLQTSFNFMCQFYASFNFIALFAFNCTKHCIQEDRCVNVAYILLSVLYVSCDLMTETVNVEVVFTKLLWKGKLW
jgi:hypothetical protein